MNEFWKIVHPNNSPSNNHILFIPKVIYDTGQVITLSKMLRLNFDDKDYVIKHLNNLLSILDNSYTEINIKTIYFNYSIAIFSSVGILWNETLSSIKILKDFALFTKDTLEIYFNLKIPFVSNEKINIEVVKNLNIRKNIIKEIEIDNTSNWFNILGLITLGIIGTFTIIIIGDILQPEITSQIPYIRYILDPIYETIVNWFYPYTPKGGDSSPILPDVISRSSSGESTVRASSPIILPLPSNLLTPPQTPSVETNDELYLNYFN